MGDQRAVGDRRVGRAERGKTDLRNILAEHFGGDRQAVHVGELALVGRHAVRREALDMLDRVHALAHRKADILGADVVLEIDERLGTGLRPGTFGSTNHATGPVEAPARQKC